MMPDSNKIVILNDGKITKALKCFRAAYDEMVYMNLGPFNIRFALLLTELTDLAAAKNNNISETVLDALRIMAESDFKNKMWSKHWETSDDRRSKN